MDINYLVSLAEQPTRRARAHESRVGGNARLIVLLGACFLRPAPNSYHRCFNRTIQLASSTWPSQFPTDDCLSATRRASCTYPSQYSSCMSPESHSHEAGRNPCPSNRAICPASSPNASRCPSWTRQISSYHLAPGIERGRRPLVVQNGPGLCGRRASRLILV